MLCTVPIPAAAPSTSNGTLAHNAAEGAGQGWSSQGCCSWGKHRRPGKIIGNAGRVEDEEAHGVAHPHAQRFKLQYLNIHMADTTGQL